MPFRMRLMVVTLAAVFTTWTSSTDAGTGKRGEPLQSAELVRLVYPVADLVVPIEDHWPLFQPRKPAKTKENELVELIRTTIAPKSWKDAGGVGMLQYYPLGMALVVNQTKEIHDEIRDILNALRKLQEVEVAVELRIVQVRSELAADLKDLVQSDDAQVTLLSQKQLVAWLNLAQADSSTEITQAPKMTIFNGQHAGMMIGNRQPFVTEYRVVRENDQVAIKPQIENVDLGVLWGVLPTVSADRRSVRLKVDFQDTSLDGSVGEMPVVVRAGRKGGSESEIQAALQQPKVRKLVFKQECNIPDGRTLAVSLGEVAGVEVRNESGPPVLKDIPFLRRYFVNVGYGRENREVFLFITPRIIITEAEEQPVLTEIPAVPRP